MASLTLNPGDGTYEDRLSGVFNATASASQPSLIVQPSHDDDVSAALGLALQNGLSVSVYGGGASCFCAQDDQLMLDLSAAMKGIFVEGNRVRLQGGVSMGMLLSSLAPHGRMVPV